MPKITINYISGATWLQSLPYLSSKQQFLKNSDICRDGG